MTPTENWPKPFLLQMHEQAVEHGFVWIRPITESEYESLKSRMYRIRRRSDTSMAAFIRPEYHLVMVGAWEPENGGQFPLLYDKRADGQDLPRIELPTGEEASRFAPAPKVAAPPLSQEALEMAIESLEVKPEEIGDYVDELRKKAEKRALKEQGHD
jgi:hypothetical protein